MFGKVLLSYVLSFNVTMLFGTTIIDSSGIYITKSDFVNDRLQYSGIYDVRLTSRPFWTNFSLNTDAAPVKIKLKDGTKKTFLPGSFYGFKTQEIKFIYIKHFEEYLAVISDSPPLYLFIRKEVHFSNITAFDDTKFYYATILGDSLREFNVENIRNSFGDGTAKTKILAELLAKIKQEGLDAEMRKKEFFMCKKLIDEYLLKITSDSSSGTDSHFLYLHDTDYGGGQVGSAEQTLTYCFKNY